MNPLPNCRSASSRLCAGHRSRKFSAVDLPSSGSETLSVSLEGGAPAGRRYDVEAKRIEGDAEVLGQGFCARSVGRPDLSLFLPTGRYRVRLLENGVEGPTKELSLDIPGVRGQVRLSPPR